MEPCTQDTGIRVVFPRYNSTSQRIYTVESVKNPTFKSPTRFASLDTASHYTAMEDEMKRPNSDDPPVSASTKKLEKLAVASKKQPPPESLESIRVRSLVVASFWVIVILVGLPTWWWTTSIHRARLPLREMLEWADGKVNIVGQKCFHPRLM